MSCDLVALTFGAFDPRRQADFWGGVLARESVVDSHTAPDDSTALLPGDDTGPRIRFAPSRAPKLGQNRMHLDLTSSSAAGQQQTVARALATGGRHIDVGQLPEEGHVVLADPEGNEFCVIEPGNSFLAGCGLLGALACDGMPDVGHFWSEALGWPLVWDQDEETAIQSPRGGTKITWGGPPLMPRTGTDRVHLDLAPTAGVDLREESNRLLALGATRLTGGGDASVVVMADPGGTEFCLSSHG